MLVVDSLSKVYEARNRRVQALADISFSLADGEFACVVGPSGCGKTTLLRCVAGLLAPTSGQAVAKGRLAVVFQEYGRSLFPWLRVRENVGLTLPKTERAAKTKNALEAVGLTEAADAYPWQLSGGMQQRVAIARAIAYGPSVLLMDEPFAAVDAQTRADLEDLIRDVWHRLGVTLLFITHDIDESIYLGQRVIVLTAAPARVAEEIIIDLPDDRDQLTTRGEPRFAELRGRIYAQIQKAKRGSTS